MVLNQCSD